MQKPTDYLQRLPVELRLQIFADALTSPVILRYARLGDSQIQTATSIISPLLTSRYVHNEARNLLYELNTFKLTPQEVDRFANPQDFSRIREIRVIRPRGEDEELFSSRGLRGLGQRIIALVEVQTRRSPTGTLALQRVVIEEPEAITPNDLLELRQGTRCGSCEDVGIAQWRLRLPGGQQQRFELLFEHPLLRRLWDHILASHPRGSADDLVAFSTRPLLLLSGRLQNPFTEVILTAVLDHSIHAITLPTFPDSWPAWMGEDVDGEEEVLGWEDLYSTHEDLDGGKVLAGKLSCLRDLDMGMKMQEWTSKEDRKTLEWANDVLVRTWYATEGGDVDRF